MNWFVFWRKCNENNWVIQIMSEEVAGGFTALSFKNALNFQYP